MSLQDYNARIEAQNAANGISPEQYEKAVAALKKGALDATDQFSEDELERHAAIERMRQRCAEDGLTFPEITNEKV